MRRNIRGRKGTNKIKEELKELRKLKERYNPLKGRY